MQNQTELVPNVTHVFTQDQHLYLQYEVYDAARGKNPVPAVAVNTAANSANAPSADAAKTPPAKTPKDGVRVFTSIEFLQGSVKVYESKPIVANEVTAPDRKAVIFQIDLPLQSLRPGFYVCQVNVVDDVSGNFAFPRSPILVKEPAPQAASTAPIGK